MIWTSRTSKVIVVVGVLGAMLVAVWFRAPVVDSQLFSAVEQRNASELTRLLSAGADPNVRDEYEQTPLYMLAALQTGPLWTDANEENLVHMMRQLLDRGADPNAQARFGFAPLHKAYRPRVVKLLVDRGADVNVSEPNGETPLHARMGDMLHVEPSLASARILLAAKAQVGAATLRGSTPLHVAARYNNIDGARLLLANGAHPDSGAGTESGTPLHASGANGDYPEMARLLVHAGATINATDARGATPLSVAEWRRNAMVAEYLRTVGGTSVPITAIAR